MFVGLFLTYTLGLHFISHAQFPDKGWSTHVLSFGILNTFFFLTWATTGNIKLVACVNLFRNGIPMVFLPIGNLVNLTHFPCHNEEQSCSKATTVACSNSYRSCQPSNERNSYNCKCPQHHSHSSCSDWISINFYIYYIMFLVTRFFPWPQFRSNFKIWRLFLTMLYDILFRFFPYRREFKSRECAKDFWIQFVITNHCGEKSLYFYKKIS